MRVTTGSLALLAAATALLAAGPPASADGDPPPIAFTGGSLRATGDYGHSQSSGETPSNGAIVTESLTLGAQGYAYDPAFLSYTVGGLLGFDQTWSGLDDDVSNMLGWGGNASAVLFSGRTIQLRLFGMRSENQTLSSDYAALRLLHMTTQQEGVGVDLLRWHDINATAEYRHEDTTMEGIGAGRESIHDNVTVHVSHDLPRLSRSYVNYLFDDGQEVETKYHETMQTLSLSNIFTPAERVTFTTLATYFREDGSFTQDNTSLSETASIVLLPKDNVQSLTSSTAYGLGLATVGGTVTSNSISETLTHTLFDSLSESVSGNYSIAEGGGGTIQSYGGGASIGYQKQVPLGVFSLGYGFSFSESVNSGVGVQTVFHESHVLSQNTGALLAHADVDLTTITVANAASMTLYVLGVDYYVVPRGTTAELVRVPTGIIAEGATVLVNYSYSVHQNTTTDFYSQTGSAGYAIGMLRLYYRVLYGHTEYLSGAVAGLPDLDTLDQTAGAEITKTGPLGSFQVRIEYRDVPQASAPFRSLSSSAGCTYNVTTWSTAGLEASDGRTWYRRQLGMERTENVSARLSASLGELRTTLAVGYTESSGVASQSYMRYRADASYTYGDTSIGSWVEYRRRTLLAQSLFCGHPAPLDRAEVLMRLGAACSLLILVLGGCASPGRLPAPEIPLVWPQDPEQPRIALASEFRGPRDLKIGKGFFRGLRDLVLGGRDDVFVRPYAVAVWGGDATAPARLAVADTEARAVYLLDLEGASYKRMTDAGEECDARDTRGSLVRRSGASVRR